MRKRWEKISEKEAVRLDEPRLSVAPLIDVCFLLMIYFMVTTTIKPPERDLGKQVPGEGVSTSPPRSQTTVTIQVRAGGEVVLNPGGHESVVSVDPAERELPKLVEHLEMVRIGGGGGEQLPVLVRAEGRALHQRVVDVMNALEAAGWTRVAFLDEEE